MNNVVKDHASGQGLSEAALLKGQEGGAKGSGVKVPQVARGRLVRPVFLILLVSFLSICGFLWHSSRELNGHAADRDLLMANSVLSAQRRSLETLVENYGIGTEPFVNIVVNVDNEWIGDTIGRLLAEKFSVSSSWILGEGESVLAGFYGGLPTGLSIFDLFGEQVQPYLAWIRRSDVTGPVSVSGYVRSGNLVHMVAAAPVLINESRSQRSEMGESTVLMVSVELDESFLDRSAMRASFPDLEITFDAVPKAYLSIPLFGLEGDVVARAVWPAPRPGDALLRPLSPALALGLVAIGYFLYLFVRGADLFMERQALLATALQHEQALRNLKFRFVSMVTHELRTPLAAIRSATELLERYSERMTDKDKAEEHTAIHRSVDTLTRLVDNVVIMGKSDWLESKSPPQDIDLVDLCQQIWEEVIRGQDSPHKLVIKEEGERRSFRADLAYIRAMLANLLQNAVKYSPKRPEVVVHILRRRQSLVIRVTDYGIGIPADEIDGIFEPFRRAKNTESMSGSGLGLAIVRAAAQALGGTTKVKSELGKGTTFEVIFPEHGDE